MKWALVIAAIAVTSTNHAVADQNAIIFERLKSPASLCIEGDPCAKAVGKVSAIIQGAPAENGANTVKMLNSGSDGTMVFEPAVLKIAVGESVTFVPTDAGHNSASVPKLVPNGADAWQGGMSEEFKVTFEKEGIYVYQCTPHVMMAMVGVIVVGKPNNLEQVIADSKGLEQSFMMNNDRLSGYLSKLK